MQSRQTAFALVLILLSFGLAMAPVAATDAGTAQADESSLVHECAAEPPADGTAPDGGTGDVIGWVDGYWYDDTLDLEAPLTESELDSFVARTAARVEALRCLTFDEVPPVDLVTRDELAAEAEQRVNETSERFWQFENARFATLLAAGQATDARDIEIESQATFPAAFYDTSDRSIGFVAEDTERLDIDQVTLAHELLHALQDQQFGIADIFQEPTTDDFISSLAVVEGDAVLLEKMYAENCETGWPDECLESPAPQPDPPATFVPALNQLAAYHTPLVEERFESGGWAAVDPLFEEMPASTVEAIYPELYGEFERESLDIPDESTDEWERITIDGADRTILGQQKFTAIFVAPTFEDESFPPVQIVPIEQEFLVDFDLVTGEEFYNYGISATDGWQGDGFVAYENEAGETAGVLKTAWEDAAEAELFRETYEELATVRDGELDEFENVYTFDESDEYDMVLGIEQDGDRVWIVTAPTVEALQSVHELDLEPLDTNGENGNGADDGTNGADDGVNGADDGTTDGTDDGVNGADDGVNGTDDGVNGADDGTTDDGTDGAVTDDVDDDGAGFGLVVAVGGLFGVTLVILVARDQR